ncbi:MAG TPA: metal-dependent hydrolase [Thermoanaerobaculia bacterium]|nr:metal-dependent hydrolase [Thermoanaerobaculia bacterium]
MQGHARPKITYLGHSTVRLDLAEGQVVVIDPWVDTNPACPAASKDLGRLDAILITHGHSDHMNDAVALARRYRPEAVVCNWEIGVWLQSQGVANVRQMNTGGTQDVMGLAVTMVRADHSSTIQDGDRVVNGGNPAGYVVRLPSGYTLYHAGDTALFSDMQLIAELWRPELAFLPIGDLFTMDPQQAARACRYLGVRRVIPVHWGTFPMLTGTPEALRLALDDIGVKCEVLAMKPGESW